MPKRVTSWERCSLVYCGFFLLKVYNLVVVGQDIALEWVPSIAQLSSLPERKQCYSLCSEPLNVDSLKCKTSLFRTLMSCCP